MNVPIAVPRASSDPLPEIATFLEPFAPLFRRVQSRHSLERYVTGLLTDLGRKNCDTISAAVAGTSTERLQHLLTDAEWDPLELDAARVRSLLQKSPKDAILLLDDTSFPKKGNRSVGVARQYCGELGKRANCQVVVSAHYVADEPESRAPLHWPVSTRLYLPEEEWANDPGRRERAHVPEEVGFETKPQIALSLVERALEWEVPFGLVVAAEEAGTPPYKGRGQPPKERPAPLYTAKEMIESVPEEAWRTLSWREGTKGTLSKRVVALRAHRGTGSPHHSTTHRLVSTAEEGWLIGERPPAGVEGETKYYYSTLPANTTLARLTALAHSRWSIEQFYEDAKGECGLGDYQGRRWDGLHRHLALVMLAYSFLMLHSSVTSEERAGGSFSPLYET